MLIMKKGAVSINLLLGLIIFIVIATLILVVTLRSGGEASSLLDREFCKFSKSGRTASTEVTLERCPTTIIKIEENKITLDGEKTDLNNLDDNKKEESVNQVLANQLLKCWSTVTPLREGFCSICADIVIDTPENYYNSLITFIRNEVVEEGITYQDKINEKIRENERSQNSYYYRSNFPNLLVNGIGVLAGEQQASLGYDGECENIDSVENREEYTECVRSYDEPRLVNGNYFIVVGRFNDEAKTTSTIIRSEDLLIKCQGHKLL